MGTPKRAASREFRRLVLRTYLIEQAPNRAVRRFWRTIEALPPAKRDEKLAAAARRISEFLLPQATRRIFAARDRAIDFRKAMDDGECLLIDLSYGHGRISKDEARLLGTFMLNDIFLSCLGRPPGSTPVYIYIDEVQLFLTETVAAMLDQARKFGVHLILSHQHLGHLRERGEAIYRSVMTNTRTKIIFGGLDDDDATLMARNLYRGTFDPELAKARYDKPVVTGQVREWMRSESDSRGTAHAIGTTESHGGSHSTSRSTTKSEATTRSESDTVSESDTISESDTVSESHTDSESESSSSSSLRSSSVSDSTDSGYSANYDYGSILPRDYSRSQGSGSSSTSGESDSHGSTSTRGSADTYGTAHTTGRAHTDGRAHTTGTAVTEGTATTEGTTIGTNWSRGTSATTTQSRQHTDGRSQTLASTFTIMPTQAYSIDEQVHLRSVELAHLDIGEAVVKIGKQPPYRVRTIRFRDGWARQEHVETVKRRIAAKTPFMTPVAEIAALYRAWRRQLIATVHDALNVVGKPALDRPEPPPLKDEGWG
jgi:Type IV secretion-system coupling protein DNA-binding domain